MTSTLTREASSRFGRRSASLKRHDEREAGKAEEEDEEEEAVARTVIWRNTRVVNGMQIAAVVTT